MSWSWIGLYQCGSRNTQNCKKPVTVNYETVSSLSESKTLWLNWLHDMNAVHILQNTPSASALECWKDSNHCILREAEIGKFQILKSHAVIILYLRVHCNFPTKHHDTLCNVVYLNGGGVAPSRQNAKSAHLT